MTQEEKQLLLKDLCARLPYRVKVVYLATTYSIQYIYSKFDEIKLDGMPYTVGIGYVKPYLRPISSMTEEEADEFEKISNELLENGESTEIWDTVVDWLNSHHFDHRGLIPMGLALEAPEGMYKIE